MRKSTLFLSILLTGVVLVLLYVLVSTYRNAINTAVPVNAATQAQEQVQPQQNLQSTPDPLNAPIAGSVQIYDAAATAARVLGRSDVYITEYTQLNGIDVYLVTFLSGDLVYVGMDGQVVSKSKQEPLSAYQPTSHR